MRSYSRFTVSNLRSQQILQALYGFQLLCEPAWAFHERVKIARKPYFDDALLLFEILVLATGEGGEALAEWQATLPFNPDGAIVPDGDPPWPVLSGPGGVKSWRWGDPRLGFALERSLGRSVELVRDIESQRGVIVATVPPEIPPPIAGINVQLSLDLPPLPGVRLVIDHLGGPKAALPETLRLVEQGAKVKATRFGASDHDVADTLREITAANPAALLFGTDLPGTRAPRAWKPRDLELVLEIAGERALWDNAAAVYLRDGP